MNTDVANYGSDGGGKAPCDKKIDLQIEKCMSVLEQLNHMATISNVFRLPIGGSLLLYGKHC